MDIADDIDGLGVARQTLRNRVDAHCPNAGVRCERIGVATRCSFTPFLRSR